MLQRVQEHVILFIRAGRNAQAMRQSERAQRAHDQRRACSNSSVSRLATARAFERHHHEIRLRRHHFKSHLRKRFGQQTASAHVQFERPMHELAIVQRGDSGHLGERARLKRQLHFQQIRNQLLMRESVAHAHARQSVDFRIRPQRDHVVVAIMHRIRIARIVLGVFEIRFVQNDQDALRHVLVELVEFLARENRAGGIIRIRQIDDLGFFRDRGGQSRPDRNASRDTAPCGRPRRATCAST